MSNLDHVQRFLFTNSPIRGEIVGLYRAYQDATTRHQYPQDIKELLGQFLAASALLSTTIKFKGSLILQAKFNGCLKLLMAECREQKYLRAIARYKEQGQDSIKLIGDGQLAITIEPNTGNRYQGIIEIGESHNLAETLENYFRQSEQIDTRIMLCASDKLSAGILIQKLPQDDSHNQTDEGDNLWDHVCHLIQTLNVEELLHDQNEHLLTKLFHQESVRVFKPSPLEHQCSCSLERSATAILSLGQEEANEIIEERGTISIDCQFCFASYEFNESDVKSLFEGALH